MAQPNTPFLCHNFGCFLQGDAGRFPGLKINGNFDIHQDFGSTWIMQDIHHPGDGGFRIALDDRPDDEHFLDFVRLGITGSMKGFTQCGDPIGIDVAGNIAPCLVDIHHSR